MKPRDERQDRAAQLYAENIKSGGNKSKQQILLEAGYSPTVAQSANVVTKTPSFQALLDSYLGDEFLLSRHVELVASENEPVSVRALELAYKVKKRLGNEVGANVSIQVNFGNEPSHAIIDGEVVDVFQSGGELSKLENKLLDDARDEGGVTG